MGGSPPRGARELRTIGVTGALGALAAAAAALAAAVLAAPGTARAPRGWVLALALGVVVLAAASLRIVLAWRRGRALADDEARYRALFTLMPTGAAVLAPDGSLTAFNDQAHASLGYSREELARARLDDLDASGTGELGERLRRLRPGEPLELDARLRTRAGEVREVRLRARAAEGHGPPAVLVTWLDVTSGRRAEESLRTAHRAVLALSRCNEMLVRSTTEEALYRNLCRIVVEEGGYLLCWVGLAEHDARKTVRPVAVAGQDHGFLATADVVWADAARGRGPTGTAIRTGRPALGRDFAADPALGPWREQALRRGYRSAASLPLLADGRCFGAVTFYSGEPDAFDDAELHFLMQLAEDVSFGVTALRARAERDRLTSQLVQTDRLAAMGTLAAGVAHEVNNPLAYVIASHAFAQERLAQLGARVADPALAEIASALDDAQDGAERVRQIVRDLRTFSRVDESGAAPADLRRVLDSALSIAWSELKHRARVVKAYGPVPAVLANEAKLGQVFLNLLINAAQALEDGHAEEHEIRVVTGTEPDGRARVEIQDSGPGVPPELRERIFDPFFTTKRIGEGTGLGLAICRNIVTSLGGTVAADGAPGGGAIFRVLLPAAPAEAHAAVGLAAPATAPGRRGRVAVVDDEPAIRRAAQRMLAAEHDVVLFGEARELGDRVAAGERFDAILCDLLMPDVTGMDLHRRLRELDPGQANAMVFVTGGAFTPEGQEFLASVPNPVLEKPFDAPAVRAAIRACVREA